MAALLDGRAGSGGAIGDRHRQRGDPLGGDLAAGFVGITGNPAFVTNENGQRIAKVGDRVTLGGGEVAPETWQTCGELTVIAP